MLLKMPIDIPEALSMLSALHRRSGRKNPAYEQIQAAKAETRLRML